MKGIASPTVRTGSHPRVQKKTRGEKPVRKCAVCDKPLGVKPGRGRSRYHKKCAAKAETDHNAVDQFFGRLRVDAKAILRALRPLAERPRPDEQLVRDAVERVSLLQAELLERGPRAQSREAVREIADVLDRATATGMVSSGVYADVLILKAAAGTKDMVDLPRLLRQSVALRVHAEDRIGVVRALIAEANAHRVTGNAKRAVEVLEIADRICEMKFRDASREPLICEHQIVLLLHRVCLSEGQAREDYLKRLRRLAATLADPVIWRETYIEEASHWAFRGEIPRALDALAQVGLHPESFSPSALARFPELARLGAIRAQVEILCRMDNLPKARELAAFYRESVKHHRSAHHARVAQNMGKPLPAGEDLWSAVFGYVWG